MKQITLPASAVDILPGRNHCDEISALLISAYWLFGKDDFTALHLLESAHKELTKLADAMGYTLLPKAEAVEAAE